MKVNCDIHAHVLRRMTLVFDFTGLEKLRKKHTLSNVKIMGVALPFRTRSVSRLATSTFYLTISRKM
jgi:hypothetical protein